MTRSGNALPIRGFEPARNRAPAPAGPTSMAVAARRLRAAALGGGTGLPLVLRGLKRSMFGEASSSMLARDGDRLTAVVTVADDGGSSGRLRQAYRMLPPGDIRNCLLALSNAQSTLAPLFNFRFAGQGEIGGHSLGNLILSALSDLQGDFCGAVEQAGRLLGIRGRILPVTLDQVGLEAEFDDGSLVEGESRIPAVRGRIRRVRLRPRGARVLPEAAAAIEAADIVVIGPGSLYTSLIPILLVDGVVDAAARCRGRVVLAMNLMTEPGETDDYTAVDHVLAIRRHAPRLRIDDVVINTAPIPRPLLRRYSTERAVPVAPDGEILRALGYRAVQCDLLSSDEKVRHDPEKLTQALLQAAINREAQ